MLGSSYVEARCMESMVASSRSLYRHTVVRLIPGGLSGPPVKAVGTCSQGWKLSLLDEGSQHVPTLDSMQNVL